MKMWLTMGAVLAAGVLMAAAAGPTVEVTGVRVAAGVKDEALKGFGWEEGVALRLQFTVGEGTIVEFDNEASKLTSIQDDKGTDLLGGAKPQRFGSSGFSMMANFSKDRKMCAVDVNAPKAPVKGASAVALKGEAALTVAAGSKEETVDNVALKAGTKLTLGGVPLDIKKVGKADWGEGTAVTFHATKPLTAIAEIRFVDADGAKLEVSDGMSSSMGFGTTVEVERSYVFKTVPATARVVAKVWTEVKAVKVPLDLKVGLGM